MYSLRGRLREFSPELRSRALENVKKALLSLSSGLGNRKPLRFWETELGKNSLDQHGKDASSGSFDFALQVS
jgi:hypothetical protein